MSILFKKSLIFGLILVLGYFIFNNNFVLAQDADSLIGQTPSVQLNTSSETPSPGDSVDLNLTSDSINLDSSKITWYIDGVAKSQGIGEFKLSR